MSRLTEELPINRQLFSAHAQGEQARLAVRDEGIGILEADQQRIFERFERAVDASLASGLGLGLYITRQIVEAHGGAIRVESQPGRGATFTVMLSSAR